MLNLFSSHKKKGLDEGIYQDIFKQYFEPLRAFVYYQCGNEEAAKDIAQESFVRLWERRKKIEVSTAKSYLYQTANNLFVSRWRHQQVKLRFEYSQNTAPLSLSPEEIALDNELQHKLEVEIGKMQSTQRVAFLMSRHEGLSYTEIADRLGISKKAVEKRMSLALKHLRSAFPEVETLSKKK